MRLRIGLLGLSSDWSSRHLPALRLLQDRFEVAGVYSSVSAFADSAAREFGAVRSDGFRNLLARDDIDAALMLGQDWYGTAPIEAACDHSKAIYCGSEIEFEPRQAAKLKRRVDESGIAFVAEFPRRYAPASLRLTELIATRLGKPQLLFCHKRITSEPKQRGVRGAKHPQPRVDRELLELIDWCSFIVGSEPRSVQCTRHFKADSTVAGEVDYQAISLDLSAPGSPLGTTIAQISCGTYIPKMWHEAIAYRPPAAVQVCCENGLAFVDLPNTLVWFDEAGRHQESLEAELSVGQQLLSQFHRAVTSLVRKMGDLEDVYRSLRALQAAERSASERHSVSLSSGDSQL